jgi:hypothetical protein
VIDTYAGRTFAALATGAPAMTGVSYRVTATPSGAVVIPDTSTGISEPSPGVYAATLTLPDEGDYVIRWTLADSDGDPENNATATEEIRVRAAAHADLRPTLADLASIMQSRVYNGTGEDEVGTFTYETRPTAEQAETIIDRALGLVTGRVGSVPASLREMVRSIVALRAAMLVETSYFPNETGSEDSAYAAYRDQYRDALADYDEAVNRNVGETGSSRVWSVRMVSATLAAAQES